MNEAVFSQISMAVLLTGLMVWMGFIVWDLAKKSKAGKFGTFMMFTIMGAGVLGFVIKTVLVEIIQI
jgi:predicted RND superfamily exporter protein